ncbi:hypothetical protein VTK26DRAFT_6528 [Humicola hyalothermophila]
MAVCVDTGRSELGARHTPGYDGHERRRAVVATDTSINVRAKQALLALSYLTLLGSNCLLGLLIVLTTAPANHRPSIVFLSLLDNPLFPR